MLKVRRRASSASSGAVGRPTGAGTRVGGDQVPAPLEDDVLGEPVVYAPFRATSSGTPAFPAARGWLYTEFSEGLIAQRDSQTIRVLVLSPQSFRDWLVAHKGARARWSAH
jgi:hypothetical protein